MGEDGGERDAQSVAVDERLQEGGRSNHWLRARHRRRNHDTVIRPAAAGGQLTVFDRFPHYPTVECCPKQGRSIPRTLVSPNVQVWLIISPHSDTNPQLLRPLLIITDYPGHSDRILITRPYQPIKQACMQEVLRFTITQRSFRLSVIVNRLWPGEKGRAALRPLLAHSSIEFGRPIEKETEGRLTFGDPLAIFG